MAVVKELIRTEENGVSALVIMNYRQNLKHLNFPYQGDVYKVKTFKEITKLERNGMFVYESCTGNCCIFIEAGWYWHGV